MKTVEEFWLEQNEGRTDGVRTMNVVTMLREWGEYVAAETLKKGALEKEEEKEWIPISENPFVGIYLVRDKNGSMTTAFFNKKGEWELQIYRGFEDPVFYCKIPKF